ncbi:MAG: 4Fe-4S dicluster domain-containing protein [Rikenellaceae bacterium]
MNRLRSIRIGVATLLFVAMTLLFLDFTGTIHIWLGWLARVQFIPALLSLNVGIILLLLILTLIFGRLYCSVICPLGIYQDIVSRFASMSNKKRKFSYSPAMKWLRYLMLVLLTASIVLGVGSVVSLLDPYSSFGVIVSNLLSPIYKWGNNLLAMAAEHYNSYAFYSVDVFIWSFSLLGLSVALVLGIGYLAWRNGRTYCNTICPVGTLLGFVSKFSMFKVVVDESKCNGCQKCVRNCKSACITPKERDIEYDRCVVCFDCIDNCNQGAISYRFCWGGSTSKKAEKAKSVDSQVDSSKRNMLAISAALMASSTLSAKEKLVDGGLAFIEDKKIPKRGCPIVPAGSSSLRNFSKHCTGCQLCVSVCPNGVLRPATGLTNFMQPEMSYERGYCRPECTKCSEVCPTGAIEKIDRAEKSSIQIGHAVWIEKNCVVLTDGVDCGNCAAHCPVGAISMIKANDTERYGNRLIPAINTQRCIGCGACENLCPSRPFSAIYVEGHSMHSEI